MLFSYVIDMTFVPSPWPYRKTNGVLHEEVDQNVDILAGGPSRETQMSRGEHLMPKPILPHAIVDPRASPPEGSVEKDIPLDSQLEEQEAFASRANQFSNVADADGPLPMTADHQSPSTPIRKAIYGTTSGMGQGEDGEPSLPSTPIHLGLEKPPDPPKGLLFSSPIKRTRRKGTASLKSSPLKPKDTPDRQIKSSNFWNATLGARSYIDKTPKPPLTAQEVEYASMKERLATLEEQLKALAETMFRKTLVSGWHSDEGVQDRDLREITKMKKEVLANSTKVLRSREEIHWHTLAVGETNEMTKGDPSATSITPASLSDRLAHFLPFSRRPFPPPKSLITRQEKQPSQLLPADTGGNAIMPFTCEISNTRLLPSTTADTLLQSQDIYMSSPSSPLLSIRFHITACISSQLVEDLQVLEMNPWAELEFGTWLRNPRVRSLEVIGKSFSRYWTTCRQRLECWKSAARNFGHILVNADDVLTQPALLNTVDQQEPCSQFGRQNILFARDAVIVEINWSISLNEDGEAESEILARPRFPETWQRNDIGTHLSKVGEAFDLLLKEKGPMQAISVIASLVFPC